MARIRGYLLQAHPESLAAVIAQFPVTGRTAPGQQVPQWLVAFEGRRWILFRGLALLASHPENADYVRQEIADQAGSFTCHIFAPPSWSLCGYGPPRHLFLQESTAPTEWESGEMPTQHFELQGL